MGKVWAVLFVRLRIIEVQQARIKEGEIYRVFMEKLEQL